MQLIAHIIFHTDEKHPRDFFSFDLYPASQKHFDTLTAASKSDAAVVHLLPLEETFSRASSEKLPAIPPESLEASLVPALRSLAAGTGSAYLTHAYRCLATCLENYARYGCSDAVSRIASLARSLSFNHSSKPYRTAFSDAYIELLRLIEASKFPSLVSCCEAQSSAPLPTKVFYVAVLDTGVGKPPSVRLRLFSTKKYSVACLCEWLRQYSIPFEVWRSLRSVMADEFLPYKQDGLYITMGEKTVASSQA